MKRTKLKKEEITMWDMYFYLDSENMMFKRKISYEQWIMDYVILGTLEAGGKVWLESSRKGNRERIDIAPTLSRKEIAVLIIEQRPSLVIALIKDPDLIGSWLMGEFNYHIFERQERFKKIEFGDKVIIDCKTRRASSPSVPQGSVAWESRKETIVEILFAESANGSCFVLERMNQAPIDIKSRNMRRFKYERYFIERNVSEKEIIRRIIEFRPERIYPVTTRHQKLLSSRYFGGMWPRWERKKHWIIPPNIDWHSLYELKQRNPRKIRRQDPLPFPTKRNQVPPNPAKVESSKKVEKLTTSNK